VQIRAYSTGVAFRYVLLDQGSATVADELTAFVFPDGTLVHSARDEDDCNPVAPGSLPSTGTSSTDTGPLTDLPLTATYADGLIACVCESARGNYPRMMLSSVSGQPNTLAAYLMRHTARGSGPVQTTSTVTTPFATPWRAVVIGATHAELVDNVELVLNLAPASALSDASWIKPGKVFRCNLTTADGLAGVDFAAARGLQDIEYDAGWYGPEGSTADATRPISAIDLPTVLSCAADKGIGVFLYVNRVALSNPDSLFALYRSWGVAGVKLGFINVGTQAMTNQIVAWATAVRLRADVPQGPPETGLVKTIIMYLRCVPGIGEERGHQCCAHRRDSSVVGSPQRWWVPFWSAAACRPKNPRVTRPGRRRRRTSASNPSRRPRS
jgi:alpha-glucosidase